MWSVALSQISTMLQPCDEMQIEKRIGQKLAGKGLAMHASQLLVHSQWKPGSLQLCWLTGLAPLSPQS